MTDMKWLGIFAVGIIYIAILYALVKPGSPAAAAVSGISTALATLVATATGSTAPASNTPQGGTVT